MTAVDVTQAEIHAESVRTALQRHQQNMLASLLVVGWMVAARDPYTGGHPLGLAGNQLACRSCRGAFEQRSDDQAVFLERKATASELDVVPDRHLINTLVPGWAGNCQLSALA